MSDATPDRADGATERVRIFVDDTAYEVPSGLRLLAALDAIGVLLHGVDIPHYCWHPKLSIDESCRLCQVEIEGRPGLHTACAAPVAEGMRVSTKGPMVAGARASAMEMLLLNHPLDCPICDQAGECTLQDFAFDYGVAGARTREPRRASDKHVDLGPTLLLDRERCILCRRCVRFCREISGGAELAVVGRGDRGQIETFPGEIVDDPYSMNLADVCPVGALTTKDFRFKIRVWDLEPVPAICGGCARGCNVYHDVGRGRVQRTRPRRNDSVNDTWMCDAGRLLYHELEVADRIDRAWLRGARPEAPEALGAVSLPHAYAEIGRRLGALARTKGAGVVAVAASAHASNEDLFTLRRFLAALGSDNAGLPLPRWQADALLVHEERAANAAGARILGFHDAVALVERIRGGGVDGLIALGHDLLGPGYLDDEQGDRAVLERLDTVVAIDHRQSPLLRVAHVALPCSMWPEREGTLVNAEGRVQRTAAAVPPPGSARSQGALLHEIGVAMGLPGFAGEYDLAAVTAEMVASFPALAEESG